MSKQWKWLIWLHGLWTPIGAWDDNRLNNVARSPVHFFPGSEKFCKNMKVSAAVHKVFRNLLLNVLR